MSMLEALRTALRDLALHKFRSALATLGIIFGVASVLAMVSISKGAEREALARIAALGVDNIIIRSVRPTNLQMPSNPQGGTQVPEYGLLRRDLAHVLETVYGVRYAVGLRNTRVSMYTPNGRRQDISVIATEPGYLQVTRSTMARGRFLSDIDSRDFKQVCVLGFEAARKLFVYDDPLNKPVRIGEDSFRTVGVLQNAARYREAGGEDINNYVFIPLATARARYGDLSIKRESGSMEMLRIQLDALAIQMNDSELVESTAQRLAGYLKKTHAIRDYELLVPLELMKQKVATQRIFTIVMASIASISLLIGGIGIMNIMLANVYDRRREIGMRRALGARRRDIVRQFLFESSTLTSLGGLVGVGVGYWLSRGISSYAGWPTIITAPSIALGLGVSCAVGIAFGLWPARQAARISPIEALRAE